MKKPGLRGGFWPSELDESLLRVALLPAEDALREWETLKHAHDTGELVRTAGPLAPILYRRLASEQPDDLAVPFLEQRYRAAAAGTSFLLEGLDQLLQQFAQANIDTIILSGAAMTLVHYREPGLRPMGDFDLLIRQEVFAEAWAAVHQAGWRAAFEPPCRYERYQQRINIYDRDGRASDLRWVVDGGLINDRDPEGSDNLFWESAEPVDVNGIRSEVLGATERLLFAVVNGTSPHHGDSRTRWVVDAWQILCDGHVDWERLGQHAERFRVAHTVHDALVYLVGTFGAPVASATIDRLSIDEPRHAAILHWAIDRRQRRYQGSFLHSVRAYVRRNKHRGIVWTAAGIAPFLQTKWGLDNPRHVPLALAKRVWKHSARAFGSLVRSSSRDASRDNESDSR